MATQDAPYDPYIPNSQQQQQGGNQQGGNARTQALQAVSFLMNLFLWLVYGSIPGSPKSKKSRASIRFLENRYNERANI